MEQTPDQSKEGDSADIALISSAVRKDVGEILRDIAEIAFLAGGQDYGASRGALLFWRVADGALLRAYVGQTSTAVLSVQFSPRGNLFAYARADGHVVVAHNPFTPAAPLE